MRQREFQFYPMLKEILKGKTFNEQIDALYLEVTKYQQPKDNKEEHEYRCFKNYYHLNDYPYLRSLIAVKDIIIGVKVINEKNEEIAVYFKEQKLVRKTETTNYIEIEYLSLAIHRNIHQ